MRVKIRRSGSNLRFEPGRRTCLAAFAANLIGAPGFEPGTSATRTQRSTGLSHAPKPVLEPRGGCALRANTTSARSTRPHASALLRRSRVGSNLSPAAPSKRTGWDSNPRGREPTRFPIVRLKPLGHPSSSLGTNPPRHCARRWARPVCSVNQRREWDGLAALAVSRDFPLGALGAINTPARSTRPNAPRSAAQLARVGSNPEPVRRFFSAEGVGFEPTRTFRSNALAGRRLKPLGHPSKAGTVRADAPCTDELPR